MYRAKNPFKSNEIGICDERRPRMALVTIRVSALRVAVVGLANEQQPYAYGHYTFYSNVQGSTHPRVPRKKTQLPRDRSDNLSTLYDSESKSFLEKRDLKFSATFRGLREK